MADQKSNEKSPAVKAVGGDHDRVVMASRKPDGSPDQTPGFEYIGDKEAVLEATKEQLRQQAVSAVDTEIRGVSSDDASGTGEPDAYVAEIKAAHDKAAEAAEKAAEAEVNAHFDG